MNAVLITDLFKGNQLEELRYWLDIETPYDEDGDWQRSPDGLHMVKMCNELNTFQNVIIDKAREVFAVHNLLPTFSTVNWYEPNVQTNLHFDTGPVEYTIMYNYFSESPLKLTYKEEQIEVPNETAVAYYGKDFEHSVAGTDGVSIRLNFNFATPDNYFFILGNHTKNGFVFPSGRKEEEVEINWLQ